MRSSRQPTIWKTTANDPARQLEDADWTDNSTSNLHEALEVLDERSRDILYQRWLAEEKPRCMTWHRSTTCLPSVFVSWKKAR